MYHNLLICFLPILWLHKKDTDYYLHFINWVGNCDTFIPQYLILYIYTHQFHRYLIIDLLLQYTNMIKSKFCIDQLAINLFRYYMYIPRTPFHCCRLVHSSLYVFASERSMNIFFIKLSCYFVIGTYNYRCYNCITTRMSYTAKIVHRTNNYSD